MKMRKWSFVSALVLSVALVSIPATPANAKDPLKTPFQAPAGSTLDADAAGTWTATASMAVARADVTATRLANGRVLVVGGVNETTPELYDPPTGTFCRAGP